MKPVASAARTNELDRGRRHLQRGKEGTAQATADGFLQAEAYSLMEYRCGKCGLAEILWNSRPHVTPFVIACGYCFELSAQHDRWGADAYGPFHVHQVGDRVFMDLTAERARTYAERQVADSWDHPEYPLSKGGAGFVEGWDEMDEASRKAAAAKYFAEHMLQEFGGHAPDIVIVDQELHQRFVQEIGTRMERRARGLPLVTREHVVGLINEALAEVAKGKPGTAHLKEQISHLHGVLARIPVGPQPN